MINVMNTLNITKQLEEIDILSAMFPNENEMVWHDPSLLIDAIEYRDSGGKSPHDIQALQFDLNLNVQEESNGNNSLIRLSVMLPKEYPIARPEFSVSSQDIDRTSIVNLKSELTSYMSLLGQNEQILLDIILWLKDNAMNYCKENENCNLPAKSEVQDKHDEFHCMWLYMHHIYSKQKRKDIVSWSHDFSLTGFCLPGKPGVVYIEGIKSNVEDYFERLRALPWKSIKCRHREICSVKVFEDFQELSFQPHGTRNNHMDFGLFYQFLVEHDLGHMFKELFGVDGQVKDSSIT